MNAAEPEIVEACVRSIKAIGAMRPTFKRAARVDGFGGELGRRGAWGEARFLVEVRARLTTESFALAVEQLTRASRREKLPPLLFATYVNPSLADRLRAEGIHFVDTVGNASLRHEGLYVWVSGRRGEERVERPVRAFQATGLRLVTLLLHRIVTESDSLAHVLFGAGLDEEAETARGEQLRGTFSAVRDCVRSP